MLSPLYTPAISYVRPAKLNVLILDCSGSMHWAIQTLAKETKERIKNLPQGDAVCVGWFSGKGQFSWIALSELHSQKDYELVSSQIDKQIYARGLTCFSDILADTEKTIQPLLNKFQVVTMVFMSDGHPTVGDYQKECNSIYSSCDKLKQYITAGAVVVFGDYANRELLSSMASKMGLEVTSARKAEEVAQVFSSVTGGKATQKITLKVPTNHSLVIGFDSEKANIFPVENGTTQVYDNQTILSFPDLQHFLQESQEDLKYKLALSQLQSGRITEALQTLSNIGDVYLVNRLYNSITNSDIASVEADIATAVTNPLQRFIKGKEVECAPKDDQFDFLDFVDVLSQSNAGFKPWDKDFQYKRIGVKSKTKDGYPKFDTDLDQEPIKFSNLVYSSDELNLSIRADIKGHILLPERVEIDGEILERKQLELPVVWKCNRYRNYSFIQNAFPNITKIKVYGVSEEEFKALTQGNVDYEKTDDGLVVDLTRLIACNRAKGQNVSLDELGKWAVEEVKLKGIVKVLKDKLDKLDPNKSYSAPLDWTENQRRFLNAVGASNANVYSPPSEPQETTDVLSYREFSLKVSGSSSVKVVDVQIKVQTGKSLNLVETAMKEGLDLISSLNITNEVKLLPKVHELFLDYQNKTRALQSKINKNRLAFALSNKWNTLTNEDNLILNVDGTKVTAKFVLKEREI